MARGGARAGSGPAPDPNSGRSERRGYTLTALPSEGYKGTAPLFPLEPIQIFTEYWDGEGRDRARIKEYSAADTESFRDRELAVWAEAWQTPQACAWSMASWRWPAVAEYCRLKTAFELDPTKSAALVAQIHRYRDQLGLTEAGLRFHGWAIAQDELEKKRAESTSKTSVKATSSRDRMKLASSSGG